MKNRLDVVIVHTTAQYTNAVEYEIPVDSPIEGSYLDDCIKQIKHPVKLFKKYCTNKLVYSVEFETEAIKLYYSLKLPIVDLP
jgi:hypothetical protein